MSAPLRECRRILAHHSKSFDLASRLFSGERRDEVAAVYAWCRFCDDAIDLSPPERHAEALESLHERLRSIYDGAAQEELVARCFQHVAETRRIPVEYPRELLLGMEMDVQGHRYETIEDLRLYGYRVAGVVGLMMCHVMGVSDDAALPHAAHLGIAMQTTNICRDVLEDLERGRVYVPAELLSAELVLALHERPARLAEKAGAEIAGAVESLLDEADRHYASADLGLGFLEVRSALAIRAARLVYAEIGNGIRRRGYDVLSGRAVVSRGRKLRLAGRALGRAARELTSRSRRRLEVRPPGRLLPFADVGVPG